MTATRWARLFRRPLLSVVIPTFNRPRELQLCLDGFAQQTTPREKFEVIVVDDGSATTMESVCEPFRDRLRVDFIRQENSGPSVARNIAIGRAPAPWLLLYDDDLRPLPDVVERCLAFHADFPGENDAALLHFSPDPESAAEPLTRWAFPRLYPFPARPGWENWKRFWSGATTCKKSLFHHVQFNPEYRCLEDTELALRLSCSMDVRVRFDQRPAGVMTRKLTLRQFLSRQYSSGFYSYKLMQDYPGELGSMDVPYDPETNLIQDHKRLAALVASAQALGKGAVTPERFDMLCALWNRASAHAHAEGWSAARDGKPAMTPGAIGALLND